MVKVEAMSTILGGGVIVECIAKVVEAHGGYG
jgi:hypothetical protein